MVSAEKDFTSVYFTDDIAPRNSKRVSISDEQPSEVEPSSLKKAPYVVTASERQGFAGEESDENQNRLRSWKNLFQQLDELLDDLYLASEVCCSPQRAAAAAGYLASAANSLQVQQESESKSPEAISWEVKPYKWISSSGKIQASTIAKEISQKVAATAATLAAGGGE
eukprot:CAMPEP_0175076742 /NCGR_PEP_ID=MMETSP0052_2-20121109/22933_1 /TAXON_ID=51329 ORGANISM="Polytomella parva, Strain SAG 63-3" /NCGR_SAMPLE_ID=MMETSP0052_2 /ASSEMBLY_ACC=CAM_ASM_000194 /LENGTH=167 /DNA_ID=CAMNT_0016345989 /DNA_START=52 /DNA_END=551 /DNA_ORIENTATION=+